MSNSLYNLTNDFAAVVNHLEEMELDSEVLQDTLDSLQVPIEEKVENIVKYMKSLEALADAKKLEVKRLSDSASSDLKKVEWFKNYMADNLKKVGIKDIQAGVFKVGFKKGSEVVEVAPNFDVNSINNKAFLRFKDPELDKTKIKAALKAGYIVDGVSLVRKPDSLTIK
jgi:hypothetical protein